MFLIWHNIIDALITLMMDKIYMESSQYQNEGQYFWQNEFWPKFSRPTHGQIFYGTDAILTSAANQCLTFSCHW